MSPEEGRCNTGQQLGQMCRHLCGWNYLMPFSVTHHASDACYEADPAIDPHLVELEGVVEILLRSG